MLILHEEKLILHDTSCHIIYLFYIIYNIETGVCAIWLKIRTGLCLVC